MSAQLSPSDPARARRRSWTGALAGAAVVAAAIAVPVALRLGDHDAPGAPDTPGSHGSPAAASGRIALGDLPTGDAPATGYMDGTTFRVGDKNTELDLGRGTRNPSAMAVVGDRVLVASDDGRGDDRMDLFEHGTVRDSWPYQRGNYPSIVLTASRSAAAFLGGPGAVVVPAEGATTTLRVPTGEDSLGQDLGGMTGTRCDHTDSDCTVLVQDKGMDRSGTYRLLPGKAPEEVDLGLLEVRAVSSRGWVGGVTEIIEDGDGACSGVADESGQLLWKNCTDRIVAFSPDGSKVLASTSAFDGSGDHLLAVLDARTGKDLVRIRTAKDAGIFHMAWEDDEHVLAAVGTWTEDRADDHIDQRWGVIRFGLDGSREYAVAPVERTVPGDFDGPFVLPLG